jgi:hypothetical protein
MGTSPLQAWMHETYGVFAMAERLAQKADVTLDVPRLCLRQSKRNNIPADSPSQYFKRAVWFPYLDTILENMRTKFAVHHLAVLRLVALIPSIIELYERSDVVVSVRFYHSGVSI